MIRSALHGLPTTLAVGSSHERVLAPFFMVYGSTPFFMVYGSEAILPTDLDYEVSRVKAYDEQGAEASLEDAMNQLDEARDVTLLCSAKY